LRGDFLCYCLDFSVPDWLMRKYGKGKDKSSNLAFAVFFQEKKINSANTIHC
jgi:hypothetical protein